MGGALLLAAAVGLLVCVGWYLTGALGIESFALRVLAAYPAAWAGLVAAAALLSVPGWMSRWSLVAAVAALAVVSFVLDRRRRSRRGSSFPPGWNEALCRSRRADSGNRSGRCRHLPRRRRVPHHAERLGRADLPRDTGASVGPAGSRRVRPRGKRPAPRREPARLRDRPLPGDARSALRAVRRPPAIRRALGEPARGRPPRPPARPSSPGGRVRRPRVRDAPGRPPARRLDPERSRRRVVPPDRGGAPRGPLAGGARPRKRRARPRPVDEVQRRARAADRPRGCARAGPRTTARARAWSRAARACCSGRPGTSSISSRRARSTGGSGTPPVRPPTTPSAACSGRCGRSHSTSSTRRGCGARSSGSRSGSARRWSWSARSS